MLPSHGQFPSRPHSNREKPQLSCFHCRRRKSRCDRRTPCANCASRGQVCTYASRGSGGASGASPKPGALPTDPSLPGRLDQLERLIASLRAELAADATKNLSSSVVTSSTDNADAPMDEADCGSMTINSDESRYVGREHWVAILDSIAELRGQVATTHETPREAPDILGTSSHPQRALLLYGNRPRISRREILESLPAKPVVDRYVARYFNNMDLVSFIIHGPSFLQEYEAFWTNPASAPYVWIALLFGIVCLAVLVWDPAESRDGGADTDQRARQIALFREKIVQCLVLGEYTKPTYYGLVAMIHYVYVEFLLCRDAREDLWFLLAIQVNMALRMGYHRDPSRFPNNISPFHGEMRRRLWASVNFSDVMISCQMGMPRMISNAGCDTAEPRNLNDSDLAPDMAELPPARPETEMTTVLGLLARGRMLKVLGSIADLTASARQCSYAEVMRLDKVLREAEASIPPPLKSKPLAASMTDPPVVIMARLFTRHMFYKGQLMLHRRFLTMMKKKPSQSQNDSDPFAYSRDVCLEASLDSLAMQRTLDEETLPGGQLDAMRWRMTSIMNDQFLTATMILCAMVYRKQTPTPARLEEVLEALAGARGVWTRVNRNGSREAEKAVQTISAVLAGAGRECCTEDDGVSSSNAVAMDTDHHHHHRHLLDDGTGVDGLDMRRFASEGLQPFSFFSPTPTSTGTSQLDQNLFTFGSMDMWMTNEYIAGIDNGWAGPVDMNTV
ncbi:hypothetical protein F5Y17DRAFT_428675 [Xylariaceae sp. FL0594]|nr:hypothetical protein F5Y17DRAFT_428675 [Xylariaceae sp. FL0594]